MNFIPYKRGLIKMKYRKSVFIVAYAKTLKGINYLVLKRKLHGSGWEFPKGAKRFYETYGSAVKRELKEETGLKPIKIKKFDIKGEYNYPTKLPDRLKYSGQSYILYAVEIKKEKIKLDKIEHLDYKWLNFNQAMKKLTWRNQRKCLKIVNDWLKNNI